jgi:hypothetical protein
MASDKEIDALCKDPARAARQALVLIALDDAAWSDWETTFLADLGDRSTLRPLSYRQVEKLLELRDASVLYRTFDGLSVGALVRDCWINRLDLDDADEVFIDGLYQAATTVLRRRPLMRLLACVRRIDAERLAA